MASQIEAYLKAIADGQKDVAKSTHKLEASIKDLSQKLLNMKSSGSSGFGSSSQNKSQTKRSFGQREKQDSTGGSQKSGGGILSGLFGGGGGGRVSSGAGRKDLPKQERNNSVGTLISGVASGVAIAARIAARLGTARTGDNMAMWQAQINEGHEMHANSAIAGAAAQWMRDRGNDIRNNMNDAGNFFRGIGNRIANMAAGVF